MIWAPNIDFSDEFRLRFHETVVVFIAGIGIVFLLSTMKLSDRDPSLDVDYKQSLILSISTRFLVPFIQLFAFY